MMHISRITKILIGVALIAFLVSFGSLYQLKAKNKRLAETLLTNQPSQGTPENTPQDTPQDTPQRPRVPDLDRPVVVTVNLTPENEKKAREEIAAAIAELKKDSDRYQEWLTLGLYRKAIGDYEGARQAWEYAGAIRPGVAVPYSNLGNLYVYELGEPSKAEPYYLKAIENEPTAFQWYLGAYEFYRFVMKDVAKAKKIVQRGIASDPQDRLEFQKLLADLEAQN